MLKLDRLWFFFFSFLHFHSLLKTETFRICKSLYLAWAIAEVGFNGGYSLLLCFSKMPGRLYRTASLSEMGLNISVLDAVLFRVWYLFPGIAIKRHSVLCLIFRVRFLEKHLVTFHGLNQVSVVK